MTVVSPPPRLCDAIPAAPASWRPPLENIHRAFGELGLTVRVFGSLAWQAVTGLPYLHDRSDVDLLADLTPDQWHAAFTETGHLSEPISRLTAAMDAAPFPCDCELRLARRVAFSLAELRGSSRQVLAKHNDRNGLVVRSSLRELAVW